MLVDLLVPEFSNGWAGTFSNIVLFSVRRPALLGGGGVVKNLDNRLRGSVMKLVVALLDPQRDVIWEGWVKPPRLKDSMLPDLDHERIVGLQFCCQVDALEHGHAAENAINAFKDARVLDVMRRSAAHFLVPHLHEQLAILVDLGL